MSLPTHRRMRLEDVLERIPLIENDEEVSIEENKSWSLAKRKTCEHVRASESALKVHRLKKRTWYFEIFTDLIAVILFSALLIWALELTFYLLDPIGGSAENTSSPVEEVQVII